MRNHRRRLCLPDHRSTAADTVAVGGDQWYLKYKELVKDWNAAVGDLNAKVAPRPVGHPLAASEAQVTEVMKLRKRGASLRDIAEETSLSLSTVRTIIGNENRTTRTWRKWFGAHSAGQVCRGELAFAEQDARGAAATDQREPEGRARSGAACEGLK